MTKALVRATPVGWLAVSEPGSVLSVGTVGPTRDQALEAFDAEIEAWAVLAGLPGDIDGVGRLDV
jgi:hypothetical protein